MPLMNITVDLGAAMKGYTFVWSNPERFKNGVIHLGDFHFIKGNFHVLVKCFEIQLACFHDRRLQKLWLWTWSVHFPLDRISAAHKSGRLVMTNTGSLLTASESIKSILMFILVS